MNDALSSSNAGGSRLSSRARRRPEPGFAHVLGAAAGAFAVVAIVAFVVAVAGSDPTAPGVGFAAALAIAALVIGFRAPGPLRSAGVTILVLTTPIIWFFALFGSGNAGRGELRGLYLLSLGAYLVLYFVGWTRGRAVLVAAALLFLASWITFEVAGDNATLVPFQNQVSTPFTIPNSGSGSSSSSGSGSVTNGTITFNNPTNNNDDTSTAALAIGVVFLVAGVILDRRKLAGAATPFIAVGALEVIAGAVSLGASDSLLAGGLLAAGAGALVGLVGGQGQGRRGSTWIGVLTVFGGLVAVLVDIAPSSAGAIGGIAFGFAVGLALLAVVLAPRLGEEDDGGVLGRTGATGPDPDRPDSGPGRGDGPIGAGRLVTANAAITATEAALAAVPAPDSPPPGALVEGESPTALPAGSTAAVSEAPIAPGPPGPPGPPAASSVADAPPASEPSATPDAGAGAAPQAGWPTVPDADPDAPTQNS